MSTSGGVIAGLLGSLLLVVGAAAQPAPGAPAAQAVQTGAAASAPGNTGQPTASPCDTWAKAVLADPSAIEKQLTSTPALSFTAPAIIPSDQPFLLTLAGTVAPEAQALAV